MLVLAIGTQDGDQIPNFDAAAPGHHDAATKPDRVSHRRDLGPQIWRTQL